MDAAQPPAAAPGPLNIEKYSFDVAGSRTETAIVHFDKMTQITVTQTGALGTLMLATPEKTPVGSRGLRVATLLGSREDPGLEVAARALAERVCAALGPRQVLVSLGLTRETNQSVAALQAIVKAVSAPLQLPDPAQPPE